MSDLLRVVERSKDDPMEIENFMAREHPGEEGDDPTAPHPAGARSELLGRAARGRRAGLGGAPRASVRARDRRRLAARGALPLLRPPGLPVPDRLRAAARARRRPRPAAGVDAALRLAGRVGARDRDGPAPPVRRPLGHHRRAARVRADGAGDRRVLRLPPAHGHAGRLRRAGGGAAALHVELRRDRPAPGRRRPAGPRGLRGVDRDVRERRVRPARRLVPRADRRGRRGGRGAGPAAHARRLPRLERARAGVLGLAPGAPRRADPACRSAASPGAICGRCCARPS